MADSSIAKWPKWLTARSKVRFMHVPPFSLSKQLSELGADLDTAILKVLRSGQYIGGAEVQAFEESFAKSVGVSHAVGCNSGTDALILALRALEIGPGDEVITCSFSFFATAEAISAVGAKPVFVDVDPNNYLIDLNEMEQAINNKTKAILPVHLFGCPVDMNQLMKIAKTNGLKVIEDCAQASGAFWDGRPVGSWGDLGCFSFFPTKNLGAAGDAGAVTTEDSELAQRVRELAVHGMPRRYVHTQLGYNSRLDALQAAVLNVKLPKLHLWVKQRQSIAARYLELLKDIPGLCLPETINSIHMKHGWNQFVVRIISPFTHEIATNSDFPSSDAFECYPSQSSKPREWIKNSLQDQGVNTIIYYPVPIHLQPAYKDLNPNQISLPVTERLCHEVLSLPIFPEISFEEQNYVIDSLKGLLFQSNESHI